MAHSTNQARIEITTTTALGAKYEQGVTVDYKLILRDFTINHVFIDADGKEVGAVIGKVLRCFRRSHEVESVNHAQRIVAHELYLRTGAQWEIEDYRR